MGLIQNVGALSRLVLILLLLIATIIGALLSYLWVLGYYVSLGLRVPETTTVTITNATFHFQDTTFFNVTLLNPSFSPSDANITQIAISTGDSILHNITEVYPTLPYQLPRGESENFKCLWNWANYTGETIKVFVLIADGSGATFQAEAPLVSLTITVYFHPAISVNHFNLTIQSSMLSVTYVNITEVTVAMESVQNVTPSLPYTLHPNASVEFMCMFNWTNYQGKNVTIAVHTLQGYSAYWVQILPEPVILSISEVLFNTTDTNHFNVTIQNSKSSPTFVNITRITITMENGTIQEIRDAYPPLIPSYTIYPNASVTFMCTWNWTEYHNKNVTITVYTLQDYLAWRSQTTPPSSSISSLQTLGTVQSMNRVQLPAKWKHLKLRPKIWV